MGMHAAFIACASEIFPRVFERYRTCSERLLSLRIVGSCRPETVSTLFVVFSEYLPRLLGAPHCSWKRQDSFVVFPNTTHPGHMHVNIICLRVSAWLGVATSRHSWATNTPVSYFHKYFSAIDSLIRKSRKYYRL